MKRIPSKLDNCPIIESVLEIRFDSALDRSVVFPILYSAISHDFQAPIPLPILQIPENIKAQDPNLFYQPYYRVALKEDSNVSLQMGPRVIAFSFTQNYSGWDSFRNYVTKYVGIIQSTNVVKKVLRMGFRVINFFDWDIYKKGIELKISLSGSEIPYVETALKTKFVNGNYESTVNILNSANLNSAQGKRSGSVIDIDTCTIYCDSFFEKISQYMDEAHAVEKAIFFNLLTDDLINSFNPSYDDVH